MVFTDLKDCKNKQKVYVTHDPQSLKYLLSSPLQKQIADPSSDHPFQWVCNTHPVDVCPHYSLYLGSTVASTWISKYWEAFATRRNNRTRFLWAFSHNIVTNISVSNPVLCVFLFKDTLFNKYHWFIYIELVARNTVNQAWSKLSWYTSFLPNVKTTLCLGILTTSF